MRPGPRGGGDCPPHLLPPAPRPYQTERTPSGPQSSVSRVPRGMQQTENRFQNGIILHANSTLETPGHLPIGSCLSDILTFRGRPTTGGGCAAGPYITL